MISASAWAYRLEGLTPLAKLLAISIANTFREDGTQAMPLSAIERFTGVGVAEIGPAFEELARFGVEYEFVGDFVQIDLPLPRCDRNALPAPQPTHWIYVVSSPNAVKVGISRDVQLRFSTLQFSIPLSLRLEWTASGPRGPIGVIEAEVHELLSTHRVHGEWFRVSARTAVDCIRTQFAKHGLTDPK